jgi:TFIIF-interacting CTD phosphatase-like protein
MEKIPFKDIPVNKFVELPPSQFKNVLILDMDETLIHCVDDIEKQDPDVVLEIDFGDDEICCAGINFRPMVMEFLREASALMQVVVFTASH